MSSLKNHLMIMVKKFEHFDDIDYFLDTAETEGDL